MSAYCLCSEAPHRDTNICKWLLGQSKCVIPVLITISLRRQKKEVVKDKARIYWYSVTLGSDCRLLSFQIEDSEWNSSGHKNKIFHLTSLGELFNKTYESKRLEIPHQNMISISVTGIKTMTIKVQWSNLMDATALFAFAEPAWLWDSFPEVVRIVLIPFHWSFLSGSSWNIS